VQKKSLADPDITGRKSEGPKEPAPLALSVSSFAKTMGVSRTFVYALIANGTIKTIKLGDRRLIPSSEAPRLLEKAA
jgi:excisionase family DNA binding protein